MFEPYLFSMKKPQQNQLGVTQQQPSKGWTVGSKKVNFRTIDEKFKLPRTKSFRKFFPGTGVKQ